MEKQVACKRTMLAASHMLSGQLATPLQGLAAGKPLPWCTYLVVDSLGLMLILYCLAPMPVGPAAQAPCKSGKRGSSILLDVQLRLLQLSSHHGPDLDLKIA